MTCFDRHLRRDLKFYMKHISCKVALISDDLSIEVPKPFVTNSSSKGILEQKFYSVWKTIQPSSNMQEDNQQESQTKLSSLMQSADYYASVTAQDCSNAFKSKPNMISSSPGRSLDYSILASDTTVSSSKQAAAVTSCFSGNTGCAPSRSRPCTRLGAAVCSTLHKMN
ncbi:hypothetical protein BHE74_00051657, partial [Ensete ventricosum]